MNYKVSEKIKCPECSSIMEFYDEDCLKTYYHCQNCGSDIENESLNDNTQKYAKNCYNLSNISYEVNQGHIWVQFDDVLKITHMKSESLFSLVQNKKVPSRLIIDWVYLSKYNGISVKEMAQIMNKSENTITKLLRQGKLMGIKISGKWIVYPQ